MNWAFVTFEPGKFKGQQKIINTIIITIKQISHDLKYVKLNNLNAETAASLDPFLQPRITVMEFYCF